MPRTAPRVSTGFSPDSSAEGCPHNSHSPKNSPSLLPPSSGLQAEQTGPARQDFPRGPCSQTARGLTPGLGGLHTAWSLELWTAGQGRKKPWGRGGNACSLQGSLWGLQLRGYCNQDISSMFCGQNRLALCGTTALFCSCEPQTPEQTDPAWKPCTFSEISF